MNVQKNPFPHRVEVRCSDTFKLLGFAQEYANLADSKGTRAFYVQLGDSGEQLLIVVREMRCFDRAWTFYAMQENDFHKLLKTQRSDGVFPTPPQVLVNMKREG